MKVWIKVWWHCFVKILTVKTDHRMCELTISKTKQKFYFCSCGYLEKEKVKALFKTMEENK